MNNEYQLPYKAKEIDELLGKVKNMSPEWIDLADFGVSVSQDGYSEFWNEDGSSGETKTIDMTDEQVTELIKIIRSDNFRGFKVAETMTTDILPYHITSDLRLNAGTQMYTKEESTGGECVMVNTCLLSVNDSTIRMYIFALYTNFTDMGTGMQIIMLGWA